MDTLTPEPGPYSPKLVEMYGAAAYAVDGPSPVDAFWRAKAGCIERCNQLNAAFAAGKKGSRELVEDQDNEWVEVRAEVLHNAEGQPNEIVNWCLGILDDLHERQLGLTRSKGQGS